MSYRRHRHHEERKTYYIIAPLAVLTGLLITLATQSQSCVETFYTIFPTGGH